MAEAREGPRGTAGDSAAGSRTWWGCLRQFGFWTLLLAAAGLLVGRILIREELDVQIRNAARRRLEQLLPGISVEIASARRLRGRGIELRGIRLGDARLEPDQRTLVTLDRVLLAAPTQLHQWLLDGGVEIFGVTIDGLRVHAVRGEDGHWNLERLWDVRLQHESTVSRISIRDARLELRDATRRERPIELHGISAEIERRDHLWKLTGRLAADRFGRVSVVGEGDLEAATWSCHGTLSELDVSSELRRLLPRELASTLDTLEHVRARGELRFHCLGGPDGIPRFSVEGTIANGRLDDARLPYPLNDISARLRIDNERIEVTEGTARMAGALVHIDATAEHWLASPVVRLDVRAASLTLEDRLRSVLTDGARRVWDRFRPTGRADLRARCQWSPAKGMQWEAVAQCRDVSIVYDKCPYPLHHVQGEVRFGPGFVEASEVMATVAGTPLFLEVDLETRPGSWVGDIRLRTEGTVPIDRQLIGALSPSAQRFLMRLEPTGRIELKKARFWRQRYNEAVHSEMEIAVRDGSLVFDDFPYPLTRVSGTLRERDGTWVLDGMQAQHGTTRIGASGGWRRERPGSDDIDLSLEFLAVDVDLDPDLRAAMAVKAPHVDALWASLRPRGVVDRVRTVMRYRSSRGLEEFRVEAHEVPPRSSSAGRTVAVHPTWFPYELDRVTGAFEYERGHLQMRGVSAWHGDTQVRLDGECRFLPDGRWVVQWNRVSADRVVVNRDLIEALPGAFGRALESTRFEGLLVLDGTMTLRGEPQHPPRVTWNVRVDVADGRMQVGLPLEQIHGGAQLYGEAGGGEFACRVELDVDSLHVRGIQVSRLQGPLLLDARQLLAGSPSEAGRTDRPPRSLTGRLFGGALRLDGQFLLEGNRPYDVQIALREGSIRELVQQVQKRSAGTLQGVVGGTLRLRGEALAAHARRGAGFVRLRDANLYELPVVVALLSVLSLKTPDRTAFSQADIDYRIDGDQILLDRIDLAGNAITLKGRGWANFQQEISLDFYSLVGRDELQIPVLRYVLAEASKRILEIRVAGTLSQPEVQGTAFPELDETLRRLFPELGRRSADAAASSVRLR